MKKVVMLCIAIVLLATLVPTAVFAKSPKTEFDLNGPHFNLNLLGKADGWNDKEVSNPERHTMFVPMDTTNWNIDLKMGSNGNKVVNHGSSTDNETSLPGFAIYMTQSDADDFAVIDGTAFDDDPCELELADGKYWVVVAVKAKPVANPPQIDGWAQVYNETGELYYYLNLGTVTVSRKWTNATDLFFIDAAEAGGFVPNPPEDTDGLGMWIFDYFDWLQNDYEGENDYSDFAYFWQLQNNGSKLIQVRFYPMSD